MIAFGILHVGETRDRLLKAGHERCKMEQFKRKQEKKWKFDRAGGNGTVSPSLPKFRGLPTARSRPRV
jgi:hypothetical protein